MPSSAGYVPELLEQLVAPHVDSFDNFLGDGLRLVVEGLAPIEVDVPGQSQAYRLWFENPDVRRPLKEDGQASDERLFPRECREAASTYKAALFMDMVVQRADGVTSRITRRMGSIPIMVKSAGCYLRDLDRAALVRAGEESTELGGYFICNGIERIIRLLILQRRHYIMALRRSAYQKRGSNYTDAATLIRCVRPDEVSAQVRCHYLTDGTVNFAFTIRRSEYFIPAGVLLKCFLETTDREIFARLVSSAPKGLEDFVAQRAELLLRKAASLDMHTRAQCLAYLGSHFRIALDVPAAASDHQVAEQLLRDFVFIHLDRASDKFNLLLAMLGKLYALVGEACCEDNPDALTAHELLLPGHLLMRFMHEKLEDCQLAFRDLVRRDAEKNPASVNLQDESYLKRAAEKMPDVGRKMEYMLNTGNLVSRSGLDLSQATGFTVVAEKLNFYRYISHFRSVHRGAYFAQLRTTTVRKLLPESWGFLCPVHTPDGSPCGLLNHMTAACRVVAAPANDPATTAMVVVHVLTELGMSPAAPSLAMPAPPEYLLVMLDGRVVGAMPAALASPAVARLRAIKAARLLEEDRMPLTNDVIELEGAERRVPEHLEVAHVPFERGGPYPGIYLFSSAARMARPVRQLPGGSLELIGALEQAHLAVRRELGFVFRLNHHGTSYLCPDGGAGGTPGAAHSHAETGTGAMLSVVAGLTPYSDYNQSPRNMYQCQMGKQTMGTPVQAWKHRSDGKLYRLNTPQTPIARTQRHDAYHMDEFPSGTNAIVAVLAYTGYDMEDAMILNKSSVERGFAHATLYKTETINLRDERGRDMVFGPDPRPRRQRRGAGERPRGAFGQEFPQNVPSAPESAAVAKHGVRAAGDYAEADRVDTDGLPLVGAAVWPGQSYYTVINRTNGHAQQHALKGEETAVVDQVTLIGNPRDREPSQASVKTRINRNPVIGDKFSSRHGQKGVLSQLWPDTDMPYAEATGMRPDLIINPHAFPSRMTIGMLVESLASKAGALDGRFVDATPFQASDGKATEPVREFGDALEAAGFARHGSETMISGITGDPFDVDIYVGPVYYQRLRHMVSDKFQVRSTGPINTQTHQPIKGRKFGGGIRFGEMERDALLAHGAAYLLHDRLHACSDYSVMDVCAACGSLLAPTHSPPPAAGAFLNRLGAPVAGTGRSGGGSVICRLCGHGRAVERVALPYVFKYLVTELAAMNVKLSLNIER